MARETQARAAWSAQACDGVCLAFAAWTVACNVAVMAGASLHALLVATAACLFVLAGIEFASRQWWNRSPMHMLLAPAGMAATADAGRTDDWNVRIVLGALAILVVAASTRFGLGLLWAGGLIFVFVASVFAMRLPPNPSVAVASRRHEIALWATVAASALLTCVVHRSDPDEPFYLNLAAAAHDFPAAALLRFDSLHGIPGIPLPPYYRVHAIETLTGAVSYLFGVEPIFIAHVVFAAVAGAMLPLALARVLRILSPGAWLWTVLLVLAVYVLDGSKHRGYGNFSFVRLYQGKSMFVSIVIPLLIAYGAEFGLAPSPRTFARLAAAQISAIGLTSTALWCAPLVACVAVTAVLQLRLRDLRTLALGVASTAWVIVMALRTRMEMSPKAGAVEAVASAMSGASSKLPALALGAVLELGRGVNAYALVLLLACVLARTPIARRVVCCFALAYLAFLMNPSLAKFVAAGITGRATYWRAAWALPMPLIVGLLLIAPVPEVARGRRRAWGLGAAMALAATFLTTVPIRGSISARNRVRLDWPGPKVPRAYHLAQRITRQVRAHRIVLASRDVSMWLPTFRDYVYPVLVKPKWLKDPVRLKQREALMHCTRAFPPTKCLDPRFAKALKNAKVDVVALRRVANRRALLRNRVLTAAGFVRVARPPSPKLELWKRTRRR